MKKRYGVQHEFYVVGIQIPSIYPKITREQMIVESSTFATCERNAFRKCVLIFHATERHSKKIIALQSTLPEAVGDMNYTSKRLKYVN